MLGEQIAEHLHLDCANCYSVNVTPTGSFKVDQLGAYVTVFCHNCNQTTEVGDGEFWTAHEITKSI